MKKLYVNIPGKEYEIIIEKGLLNKTGELISNIFNGKKIAVVTDSNVEPLYAKKVAKSLEDKGFEAMVITIPAGEMSKSQDCLNILYTKLLEMKITRTDLVAALGGGVVGDLAGYAAATLFRGIDFVQIPTTLLAQVDSSVGGKVAINLEQGKNLIGAFYQPKLVIIDCDCLKTLNNRVLSDGMAEVIKYGAICDAELFEMLENINNNEILFEKIDKIVYTCCDIKRRIVEEDEFDTGGRMVLNFGHTFGHAIEKHYNYATYTHGEAVAAGMVMACEFGEKIGITHSGVKARMEKILNNFKLPTDVEIRAESVYEAIHVDKKGAGDKINIILLEKIGKCIIKKMDKVDLK